MSNTDSVSALIEIADRMDWCTNWHCGTCAASSLRRGLEKLLGCEKSYPTYPEADMERLAGLMAALKAISHGGSAEALLLIVSKALGPERTNAILGNSPAGLHYGLMWQAHLIVEKKREIHRNRCDPNRVAEERAIKKKAKAEAHARRIEKYRIMRAIN